MNMPKAAFNQWSTIEPFIDNSLLPAFVADPLDKLRLAAYSMYEQIYRGVPDAFELVQRGSDTDPIYIPSARKCIEATNRFLGVGFSYRIDGGDDGSRALVSDAMESLFRREKFYSKFNSLKRWGLIRGDALWHITADETKPVGRRISMHELNPSKYHPIYDLNDAETLMGVHIVEPYTDPADKNLALVRRQTYRKVPNPTGPDLIESSETIFEADGWDDRQLTLNPDYEMKQFAVITSPFTLPPTITSIPVYHISNQYQGGLAYGLSDIAGFERVMAAINQGATDEELALAFTGLGVYFSTAPEPTGGWVIPPGTVINGAEGDTFERVDGIGTVTPSQDHLAFLGGEMQQAMGTPDIAVGKVDVAIAQSGIALALQMGPILNRNKEKEAELLAVHDHLFYDLINQWMPTFEGATWQVGAMTAIPAFDDPMPKDEDAIIKNVMSLLGTTPPIISVEYARQMLTERLGYEFPDQMGDDVLANMAAVSKAQAFDPFEERIRGELASLAGAEGIPVTANGSA
jgi:hypothetical protein